MKNTDLNPDELIQINCPDCQKPNYLGPIGDVKALLAFFARSERCPTCDNAKKVLVKRGDLIKFQTR